VFAAALAAMDEKGQQVATDYYKNHGAPKEDLQKPLFLLIAGDFFEIQNFIFDEVSTKYAAKTLRAKSAYVQILTKVLAYHVAEGIGLSKYAIISTHAGKFELLAPNSEEIVKGLEELQRELDQYFLQNHFGLTGVGLAWEAMSIADFLFKGDGKDGNLYKRARERIAEAMEERKFQKFGLGEQGFVLFEIDEDLDNQNLCDFCRKRKGRDREGYVICKSCRKFVDIGQALVKKPYMAISKERRKGDDIEIYEGYYLHFFDNPSELKTQNDIAIFDIRSDGEFRGFVKWELDSYVARREAFQEYESFLQSKSEEYGKSDVLTLQELAALSVREGIENGRRERGVEALMALKGDGDGMGSFIRSSDVTDSFAKYNFFARMVDYYFSVYVPREHMGKKALYTVFAGGDDMFVLGAWDDVIELAQRTRDDFVRFSGGRLTFSVGLVMNRANKPVNFLANAAEEALGEAKGYICRKGERAMVCDIEVERCEEIYSLREREPLLEIDDEELRKYGFWKKDALSLFGEVSRWQEYRAVQKSFARCFNHPNGEEFKTSLFMACWILRIWP